MGSMCPGQAVTGGQKREKMPKILSPKKNVIIPVGFCGVPACTGKGGCREINVTLTKLSPAGSRKTPGNP